MRTGTPWHAVHPTYISREYTFMKTSNNSINRVPVCASWRGGLPATTWRLTADRARVLIACPKCGETRLLEQLDGQRWFCAVCAHSWTTRNERRDLATDACRRSFRRCAHTIQTRSQDVSRGSTSEWMTRRAGGH